MATVRRRSFSKIFKKLCFLTPLLFLGCIQQEYQVQKVVLQPNSIPKSEEKNLVDITLEKLNKNDLKNYFVYKIHLKENSNLAYAILNDQHYKSSNQIILQLCSKEKIRYKVGNSERIGYLCNKFCRETNNQILTCIKLPFFLDKYAMENIYSYSNIVNTGFANFKNIYAYLPFSTPVYFNGNIIFWNGKKFYKWDLKRNILKSLNVSGSFANPQLFPGISKNIWIIDYQNSGMKICKLDLKNNSTSCKFSKKKIQVYNLYPITDNEFFVLTYFKNLFMYNFQDNNWNRPGNLIDAYGSVKVKYCTPTDCRYYLSTLNNGLVYAYISKDKKIFGTNEISISKMLLGSYYTFKISSGEVIIPSKKLVLNLGIEACEKGGVLWDLTSQTLSQLEQSVNIPEIAKKIQNLREIIETARIPIQEYIDTNGNVEFVFKEISKKALDKFTQLISKRILTPKEQMFLSSVYYAFLGQEKYRIQNTNNGCLTEYFLNTYYFDLIKDETTHYLIPILHANYLIDFFSYPVTINNKPYVFLSVLDTPKVNRNLKINNRLYLVQGNNIVSYRKLVYNLPVKIKCDLQTFKVEEKVLNALWDIIFNILVTSNKNNLKNEEITLKEYSCTIKFNPQKLFSYKIPINIKPIKYKGIPMIKFIYPDGSYEIWDYYFNKVSIKTE